MIDEQLRELFREVLRQELPALLAELVRPRESEWVAINACGLPPTTRRRYQREGRLATARIGREKFVRRADVEKLLAESIEQTPQKFPELERRLRGVGSSR